MPITKDAEQIGTITLQDGRVVPKYNVKTETTLTNVDTGAEYDSEEAAQADIDDPNTSTTAEKIGTITLEDGRVIPRYKVKTETTLTNTDTGQEYESEEAMQADIDDPNTSTTAEKIRRDVKVFAPSLKDMLGQTPKS